MENPEKIGRFSSCRGVAFEMKPHADPFAIPAGVIKPPRNSTSLRSWLPWGSLSRVVPSSELIERSMSRTSSHFCDLDDDEEHEDDVETLADIEEGHEEEKSSSRLSVILLDQGLFTVYKRLFVVCLALNITGLVIAATGEFPYARNRAALFSIANIFALVLCRIKPKLQDFPNIPSTDVQQKRTTNSSKRSLSPSSLRIMWKFLATNGGGNQFLVAKSYGNQFLATNGGGNRQ